jgi:hypothetical protein
VGEAKTRALGERGSRDLCYVVAIEHFALRRREPQGLVIKVPNCATGCNMSRARLERATTCLKARGAKQKQ